MSDPRERVVVVGSGPAGAAAAAQLVARGVPVTMLDSGVRAPRGVVVRAGGNTILRRYEWSQFEKDRLAPGSADDVIWLSSRTNGGLSNYWTGAVPRFAPADFEEGARLDERYRWPVGYDELVPYYELAERFLEVTAGGSIPGVPDNVAAHHHRAPSDWRAVIDAANRQGIGLGVIPLAKGSPWMIAPRATEFSSYHCIVRELCSSPHFELVRGAHVTRLGWNPTRSGVDEVEYVDRSTKRVETVPARAVVVAAGAIDTTMILLRSTSAEFPDGLGNSSGLVGRYLHDHPREWWSATLERPMRALSHPLYLARPDVEDAAPLMATSHTIGLFRPRQRLRTFVMAKTSQIGVQVFGTMIPKPDVSVTIDRRADGPVDEQRPVITHRYSDDEVANLESSRQRLVEVFGAAGLRVEVPGPFEATRPGTSIHFGGTVRMHGDPQFGVLDRWNRMYEVPNVVVCDLSCFTTGPEKNPTPTSMALAIRAADRLADDIS